MKRKKLKLEKEEFEEQKQLISEREKNIESTRKQR